MESTSVPTTRGTISIAWFDHHVAVPPSVVDLQSFRIWALGGTFPERGKVSYLAGDIHVEMNSEEINYHNLVKAALLADLGTFVRDKQLGEFFSGAFYTNARADLATEPDFMVCTRDDRDSQRIQFVEYPPGSGDLMEITGAPELIVEIVDDSSVAKDSERLRELYHAAGVREYWLIDARGEAINFDLFSHRKQGYESVWPDEQGYRRSEVVNRRVRLTRSLNRVGHWQYKVHLT